jgi:hypothetical protein
LRSSYPVAFDTLPFPWRQLTSLTIIFWDIDSGIILDILQACVNLEEFIRDGNFDKLGSDDSITLNYLRKLHTHCIRNMFFPSLKTPSIQDFAIKMSGFKYIYDDDAFDYIEKNGSTLLKLSIAN